ncbi:MAG: ATP-grasp domain-containing protein, partial [Sphingomonadales bacterium]|nr:ATP-grasp domain-containing protein [Sphingomonadales bacterium]
HIYAPEASGPAADVSAKWIQGDYGDTERLLEFARDVSSSHIRIREYRPDASAATRRVMPVFPPLKALEIGQDRIAEKSFAADLGGGRRPGRQSAETNLDAAIAAIGLPAIPKTMRFGYDGKGQARNKTIADADAAWTAIGECPAILEGMVYPSITSFR